MSTTTYQRIVLASRPKGEVQPDNFRLETVPVPEIKDGEVLIRNHFMSLDPYMRGRMEESKSYAVPQAIGETMIGGTVGEIVASKNPQFAVGDKVVGMLGWAEMGVSDGIMLRKVDTTHIPLSAYLGSVGMPGMTAWYGLTQIIHPKKGETVVVSAASGAVGSVVGQLAKQMGCRVVGIAGGAEKCAYVVNELGFDACIDYKAGNLEADLAAATPDGIDGVFENVGGEVFDASLARMNQFGRVALCGMIAGYNGEAISIRNARVFLTMRVTLRGFIVSEHIDMWPQGLKELGTLVATGKLKFRESIAPDLAGAPEAFIGLLKGKNFGKQLVKLV
ncbi:NADP-dependent oxidoreductase [Undibacterium sp. RTI2.1]|uniref:NADP-dependent oxidoreductase n=1 Tax=unclassified Undibacterium TaxID=2630295 RepID=UPI002AB44442|nr:MULTISPECIES: NADP-dependent oxidoreductase [unclassified Undibacterium]MDY7537311.1 NADP-dependent oxidoreductase [Undibacterium sp. 5I1]MEB0032121.1 NADP-dependent oxidoreductase [Undibacterium sp. RTI2.1]MEB0118379.1 NADP-dependent oxidoreductase [Undibacterium sp. RTI2.2]MEB0231754.1 NADP-dependent oxidoreductase [Undibacterium sp. 10I3]MEB0259237.1 NADP-dependent oxidoreductase [Undibacterium sp. 5I1]